MKMQSAPTERQAPQQVNSGCMELHVIKPCPWGISQPLLRYLSILQTQLVHNLLYFICRNEGWVHLTQSHSAYCGYCGSHQQMGCSACLSPPFPVTRMHVCVRMCVRACVRVCVCVCVLWEGSIMFQVSVKDGWADGVWSEQLHRI
jgi:hypothetical protein